MIRSTRVRLGVAAALAALALGAQAQPAANPASKAPAAHSSAQSKSTSNTRATTQRAGTKHHAMSSRTNMGRRSTREASAETTSPDSAYKAALRRCVTGPESARDSCLDEAIAQYGHA